LVESALFTEETVEWKRLRLRQQTDHRDWSGCMLVCFKIRLTELLQDAVAGYPTMRLACPTNRLERDKSSTGLACSCGRFGFDCGSGERADIDSAEGSTIRDWLMALLAPAGAWLDVGGSDGSLRWIKIT
jgi:hypothetical protein